MSAGRRPPTMLERCRRGFRRRIRQPAFRGWKRLRQRLARAEGPSTQVFVAGVQRSGTNMLMHVLERSPDTDVVHEGDPRAFDQYVMRALPVVQDLDRRSPAAFFVIKALCELDRIPAFLDAFDRPRCVWIYRDYRDVANSMLASFRSIPDTVRRLARDGDAVGWWGQGMSERTRRILGEVTARPVTDHSLAALLWYLRNVLYFEQGLDRDPRVLPVRYETLVASPTREAERVFAFLGIPFSERYTARVHATSVSRRSPPELDEEVETLCRDLLQRLDAAADSTGKAA